MYIRAYVRTYIHAYLSISIIYTFHMIPPDLFNKTKNWEWFHCDSSDDEITAMDFSSGVIDFIFFGEIPMGFPMILPMS